ncbi:AraC family transcriptional regulator [Clostridium sp. AM27-31LB]|jgi:AraC-like DNA-binding protein|uniref:AraC family transcriptional regulator n=1 Tax=Clostridia TaxID=186801 RepID=UPI000E5022BA|nr:AraC family transcriptional regulator [Clostridium sp. AM27-31LB]RHT92213.1 AraC family transcriptional regulator [Clostridium sp. AM27-31LB]UYJ39948.1 MAG: AraC family transcriptional regulator [Lachnospiraceae bacterium]
MNENELYFSIFPNERFIDLGLYQFGMEQCSPSHSYGPAARNHFLFHYIISGTGTLYADDSTGTTKTYHLKSGEGFLIFPNQITTYIADKELPWEYVWIEFDGLRAKEAMDTAGFSLDRPIFHTKKRDMSQKMEEELVYIATHSDETIFNIIGHLYLFLDYFMRSTVSTVVKGSTKLQDYYIKEAITYIEQNFQNDISVVDIANRLGINRSYFGKIFKQTLKQTPQEFLINYRMIKATELLRLTKMSIGDISKAVGYENQLHFSRAFKKIYNISPREWRNINAVNNM